MDSLTFVILKKYLNEYQLEEIKKTNEYGWYITENHEYITGWTENDNGFNISLLFEQLNIKSDKVVWGK